MALALRVVSHSEIGLVRKNNQDSGFASEHLLVVADGMGGAAAGDLASAVAVDTLMGVDEQPRTDDAGSATNRPTGPAMLEAMSVAVEDANDRIADLIADDVALDGMGTTVTAALFDGKQLGLVHIGDSRAYLLRQGRLRRLTHDHSWVQSLVDEGRISEQEAAVHPHRSLLLRVLNGQPGPEAELALVEVSAGDRLMFCSDGLCGLVDDPEIAELLADPDRDEALAGLVDAARAEGGVDNITVIVADVVEVATGLHGAPADAAETPSHRPSATILGAAAERTIPPVRLDPPGEPDATERDGAYGGDPDDDREDTVATQRPVVAARTAIRGMGPTAAATADEARYDLRPPSRRRWVRPLVTAVLVLVVVGAGLGAAYAWTRSQFYVGVSGSQVAIYRGVSERLPGLALSELFEVQPLAVSDLPVYYQQRVRSSIDVPSLAAAHETVAELRDAVARCQGSTPSPGAGGASSPTSTATTSTPATSRPSGATPSPTAPPVSTEAPDGSGC